MRRTPALVLTALLTGVLALAGCGDDDDDDAGPTRPSAPTSMAVPESVRPGPTGDLPSRALTVADLPPGWALDTSGTTARPPCVQLAYDVLRSGSSETIEQNFSQGSLGPFLTAVVTTAQPGTGSQTLQDAVRAYQTCGDIELTNEQLTFRGQVFPEAQPGLGDESYALRVELTSAGGGNFVLGSKVTLLRVGDTLGSFAFGALNNGGIEQLDDVIGRAVAKMGG